MNHIVIKYFFDFLNGQQTWLNSMAERGYRLKKCGKITYAFDECQPNEYEYAVEFVGDQSCPKAKEYRDFLKNMGLRTFTKSINLNFSLGKIRWRPYGSGMGQISTSPGSFNKELLILEKKRDETPFELHTDIHDKQNAYQAVRRVYFWAVLIMLALGAMTFVPGVAFVSAPVIWVIRAIIMAIGVLFLIPLMKYTSLVTHLTSERDIYE